MSSTFQAEITEPEPSTTEPDKTDGQSQGLVVFTEEEEAAWRECERLYGEFARSNPEAIYWYHKSLQDSVKHGRI